MNYEPQPICPHCGADDLLVVYTATVHNLVIEWEEVEGENLWRVAIYDSQEVEDDLTDVRLECRTCGSEICKQLDTDTFKVPVKEGG